MTVGTCEGIKGKLVRVQHRPAAVISILFLTTIATVVRWEG